MIYLSCSVCSVFYGPPAGAADRCCRWTAVCLGTLCVLLLVLSIRVTVWLLTERDQLLTNQSNLAKERDQRLTNHSNLLEERNQLLTNYRNLLKERDQLLSDRNSLLRERDQLQVDHSKLLLERQAEIEDLKNKFCSGEACTFTTQHTNIARIISSAAFLIQQDCLVCVCVFSIFMISV